MRLLAANSVVGEAIVHVVAIADNLDSATHRLDSRAASVLKPLLTPV